MASAAPPVRQAMQALVDERFVIRVPGKGSFVRDIHQVRALNLTVLIDLLPESHWSPFLHDIIQGLRMAAKQMHQPCNLSFVFQNFNETLDYDFLNDISKDGIIFVPINLEGVTYLNNLASSPLHCKVISYYRKLENPRISQFYMDHETGAFRATKYLLSQGYRQMVLMMETPQDANIDMQERLGGCLKAYKEAGVNSEYFSVLRSGFFYESVAHDLDRIVKTKKPEVLLVSGEILTRSVIHFLESQNLKIPDDISILFFDDSEEAKMHAPKLTTVRQINPLGTRMVLERFINELRNPNLEPVSVALKPELVIRDSCKNML